MRLNVCSLGSCIALTVAGCAADGAEGGGQHSSFYGNVAALRDAKFGARDLKALPSYIQAGDLDGDGAQDIIVGLGSASAQQRRAVLLSSRGGFEAEAIELDCAASHCNRDSLLIDANGDMWLAIVHAGRIDRIDRDGQLRDSIRVPVRPAERVWLWNPFWRSTSMSALRPALRSAAGALDSPRPVPEQSQGAPTRNQPVSSTRRE